MNILKTAYIPWKLRYSLIIMQPASPSVLNLARLTVSVFLIFFFFFLISCIFRCIGDYVSVSNPEGNFIISQLQELEDLFLLAAGTGFTPMVKVLNYALTNIPSLRYVILHLISFCFWASTSFLQSEFGLSSIYVTYHWASL